jgi:hypothetical protein
MLSMTGCRKMQDIINRYRGQATKQGHKLQTAAAEGDVLIGFMHWGEYQDVDEHHHIHIALVSADDDGYHVGWYRGSETQPHAFSDYADQDELFAALDDGIARRSAEVGPGGP